MPQRVVLVEESLLSTDNTENGDAQSRKRVVMKLVEPPSSSPSSSSSVKPEVEITEPEEMTKVNNVGKMSLDVDTNPARYLSSAPPSPTPSARMYAAYAASKGIHFEYRLFFIIIKHV